MGKFILKKGFLFFLAILAGIFFIIADISFNYIELHFELLYLSLFFFVLAFILGFSSTYALGLNKLGLKKSFLAYNACIAVFFITAFVFHLKSQNNIDNFTHNYGNCNSFWQGILKTNTGTKIVKNTLSILPASSQYYLFVAEESCRAMNLKKSFADNTPKFCGKNEEKTQCYIQTVEKILQQSDNTTTGAILHTAIGTTLVMEGKKNNPDKSKEKSVKYGLDIMKLSIQTIKANINRTKPEDIISTIVPLNSIQIPDDIIQKEPKGLAKTIVNFFWQSQITAKTETLQILQLDKGLAKETHTDTIKLVENLSKRIDNDIKETRKLASDSSPVLKRLEKEHQVLKKEIQNLKKVKFF